MFDVFKVYATDAVKEQTGATIELGGGASMLIARVGNPAYRKSLLAESEKLQVSLDSLPAEEADKLDEEIMIRVMAETILLGFKGFAYKGKLIEYSKENARKVLSHKDFRIRVMMEAQKLENYRVANQEGDVKK